MAEKIVSLPVWPIVELMLAEDCSRIWLPGIHFSFLHAQEHWRCKGSECDSCPKQVASRTSTLAKFSFYHLFTILLRRVGNSARKGKSWFLKQIQTNAHSSPVPAQEQTKLEKEKFATATTKGDRKWFVYGNLKSWPPLANFGKSVR